MRSEFEFLEKLRQTYGLLKSGDDCAVLPKDSRHDLVVTADLLIEGIDFRLDWSTPENIGHKSLAVSLSDVAAMGGEAKYAMLSIAIPENVWNTDFLEKFYRGWNDLAEKFDVELVGGDTSRTSANIAIDSIVLGETVKNSAILRSTARVGDSIYVTGPLGGAAAGLRLLKSGSEIEKDRAQNEKDLLLKQLKPFPQLKIAKQLHYLGITSMIDVSDGLSSDLRHICVESGVGGRLYTNKIPVQPGLEMVVDSFEKKLDLALNGGEDFELLFTADRKKISSEEFPQIRRIGEITKDVGKIELISDGGSRLLEPAGYTHF